jgi:hypothetical protein
MNLARRRPMAKNRIAGIPTGSQFLRRKKEISCIGK